MKTQAVISEDLDKYVHEAIECVSMAANMLHSVWSEIDYCIVVARVTKGSHKG
ncbi:hypothetical protein AVEN_60738-1, partial [Araneus ventricosus]